MSQWTHVAGIIRFDGIFSMGMMPEPDIGKTCSFDDDDKKWDECNVPCGSEGSLVCEMWKNPSETHIAARTAYIFGDLRDYENEEEIIDYFNRITEGQMVRNACYCIDVEGSPTRTFTYIDKAFVETKEPTPS